MLGRSKTGAQIPAIDAMQQTPADPSTARAKKEVGEPFSALTFEELRQKLEVFVQERDWDQFHTPRNLTLALTGELGELAEIFQWRGEVAEGLPGWSDADRTHLEEELSDVLIYLLRLSDKCGVDISRAVLSKLEKNAAKYPADMVRGSSKKYTEYRLNDTPDSTQ